MEGNAEEIQKQIEGRINELPADVQNAILASDFNQKIQTIGSAAGLHIDQIQELSDNTMLVMLGFMTEQEFKNELRQLLQSTPEVVMKIESDINSQIFLSIRDSMKKFQANQAAPEQAPQTPALAEARPSLATQIPLNKPSSIASPAAPGASSASLPMIEPLPAVQTALPATSTAPAPKPEMHPADVMLNEKTVAAPPKPQDYKADPYREPVI